MNSTFAITLILFAAVAECKERGDHATLIKHVKSMNVATLDDTLPAEQFEKWLLSGPAQITRVEYLPGNCDLKPTRQEPKGGWPLCVKVILRRGELWVHAVVTVGTIRRGIHSEPRLTYMYVSSKMPGGQTKQVIKLSELPRALAELEEADKARK